MVKNGLICGISGNLHRIRSVENNLYAESDNLSEKISRTKFYFNFYLIECNLP